MNLAEQKLEVEINKVIAETAKINKETRWYELMVLSGVIVALLAAGRFLL